MPSVLWRCWLGGRKGIRPVKNMEWWGAGTVICLERDAIDLRMVQLMPLPPHHLLLQQNPEWFILLVPAYPGCPGKKAVKRLCVCVCVLCCRARFSFFSSLLSNFFEDVNKVTYFSVDLNNSVNQQVPSARSCLHCYGRLRNVNSNGRSSCTRIYC